jgi:adenosylhomocysteine nucleosidase
VENAAFGEYTFKTFQARQFDMETAAMTLGRLCQRKALRRLPQPVGSGLRLPGDIEMSTFFALAADNSAKVVIAFLVALGS